MHDQGHMQARLYSSTDGDLLCDITNNTSHRSADRAITTTTQIQHFFIFITTFFLCWKQNYKITFPEMMQI
jgi:hypothetical protein